MGVRSSSSDCIHTIELRCLSATTKALTALFDVQSDSFNRDCCYSFRYDSQLLQAFANGRVDNHIRKRCAEATAEQIGVHHSGKRDWLARIAMRSTVPVDRHFCQRDFA